MEHRKGGLATAPTVKIIIAWIFKKIKSFRKKFRKVLDNTPSRVYNKIKDKARAQIKNERQPERLKGGDYDN